MQRAAAGLASHLRALEPQSVLLLVGTGDNGGDALYAGAALAADGTDVAIVASGERMHESGLREALARGAHVEPRTRLAELAVTSDVIVDGLVGTGSAGGLRGGALELVEALPPHEATVVAVDIPSGINPDDGSVPGHVLVADLTVTFGAYKAGLLLEPARSYAGRVVLIDIGLDLTGVEPVLRV
jgi:hydroxyethylthiazole kinase-like uncharacterized protein yjeF